MNPNRDFKDIPELQLKFKPDSSHIFLKKRENVVAFLRAIYQDEINIQEQFIALYLDDNLQLIGYKIITKGSKHKTNLDLPLLLSYALLCRADQIIICHNHPLNDASPSEDDIRTTHKINYVCREIGIPLLDHIIVSEDEYYSFSKEDNDFINIKKEEKHEKE